MAADQRGVESYGSHAAMDEAVCGSCGANRREGSWCPRCLERYEPPVEPCDAVAAFGPRRVVAPRTYSRTQSGPISFGFVGRFLLSILPALVGFFAIRNAFRSRGDLTFSFYFVMAVPTAVLVGLALTAIWKRERVS